MAQYMMKVGELGGMCKLPTIADPLREHRAVIRAIWRLYPDAEVDLFHVADKDGRAVLTELDPMPTWTR